MEREITVKTSKREEVVDITSDVKGFVKESGVKDGILIVYVGHATAAVIVNENDDPNICDDLLDCLRGLVPQGKWRHDRLDGNADAHIKSAVLGPSESFVVSNGGIELGRWQAIMLVELDGPRERKLKMKVVEG